MRIKKPIKFRLIALAIVTAVCLPPCVSIWQDDAESRRNRVKVFGLISVGQSLEVACQRLSNAGFRLMYDEPITPTVDNDYLEQLVIVGETQRNAFETFGYAMELPWVPFTRTESAYVIINANLDGEITTIR